MIGLGPALAGALAAAWMAAEPEPGGVGPDGGDDHRTEVRAGASEPIPTAVIGRDRLDAAPDLPAALDGEVGLHVTRLGGLGSFATLSIRGSTPEQVLVVLDGIPLNPADGAPVDLGSLPLGPLQAVAIYRGRAPYAFGVDAIGGVLSLRSRSTTRASVDASASIGSFDTRLVRAAVAGGGLGLAVDYAGSAGDFRFLNDQGTAWTADDDTIETRTNAAFDQGSVLGKAQFDFGENARLTLIDLFTASARGLPGLGVHPTRESRFEMRRDLGGARLDAALGPLRVGALGYVGWSETVASDPLGEVGLGSGTSTLTSVVPGANLQLSLPLKGAGWRLTPASVSSWRLESTHGNGVVSADRSVLSTALELAFRHELGIEATASGRVELAPDVEPGARVEVATTALADWRFGVSANLSHRLPSLFELYGDTGTTLGSPELRSETSRGIELDIRWDPGPDAWLEAFVFASEVDDLIQIVQNAQGVVRPANVDSARILGAELAAETLLADDHVALRGGVTWLDARDTSDIAARHGKRLPLRPTLTASGRAELRLGDDEARAGIWVEADHVAGNALDFANLVHLPARTLLGAGLWVERDAWRVEASLANLLDESVVDLAGYPLPGTTALLSVRWRPDR